MTENLLTNDLDLENLLTSNEPVKKLRDKQKVLTEDDLISSFPLLVQQMPCKNIHDLMQKIQFWGHEIMPRLTTLEFITRAEKICTRKRMRIYKEEYVRNSRYSKMELTTAVGKQSASELQLPKNYKVENHGFMPNEQDMDFPDPYDIDQDDDFDQDEMEFAMANHPQDNIPVIKPIADVPIIKPATDNPEEAANENAGSAAISEGTDIEILNKSAPEDKENLNEIQAKANQVLNANEKREQALELQRQKKRERELASIISKSDLFS